MSFSDYLFAHGYSVPPDWIFIQLGTNALFGIYSDREAEAASAASVSQLERMIAMSRSAGAVPKIGIMLVPPPSRDQNAAGANYGSGTNRDRFKRNSVICVRKYLEAFGNRESEGIYIVPTNVALDTVNNMVRKKVAVNSCSGYTSSDRKEPVMVTRQGNLVHPSYAGHMQIGDAVFAFLKNMVK